MLVRDHQLLGQDAGVTGLQRGDLQALGPRIRELVTLDRVALEVVHDHGSALARVAHLAEAGILDPLLEAVVLSETAGERDLADLALAGQVLDRELAVGGLLLELDDVLLELEPGHLRDLLDDDAVDLEAEGIADRGVEGG